MSIRPPMFVTRTASTGSSVTGQIDLREEFDKLIYGPNKDGENRHGHPIIIRRMRREATGEPTYCTCAEGAEARQGNKDCQYCFGEGYLWDEEWALTYSMYVGPDGGQANRIIKMPPGNLHVDYRLFFFRYDTDLEYGDKVVEVVLDEDGLVVTSGADSAYVRKTIYRPETIVQYRSDNGRIEYYGVYCREHDAIRNHNPQ